MARFLSADTLIPEPTNPQGWNRYSYTLNNPLKYVDPSGHCWGFASGLRNTFYATTCNNLDMAVTIVTSPDASVGQKIAAGGYIAVEAVAHGTVVVGTAIVGGHAAAAAVPYASAAVSVAQSAAIAHPTASAVVGGVAETAMECSMTGGGCNYWDYIAGAATAGVAHRLSTPSRGNRCSFSEETPVMTDKGLISIREINEGAEVLAYNEETGEIDYYPVVAVWSHKDPVVVYLTIDGETIETTPNHPFFTNEGEWVLAGNLQLDDEIRDGDWSTGKVDSIVFITTPRIMYNFTVAAAHTYFVGNGRWLVHNSCPYEVGLFNELDSANDGLDLHHVPQAHPAGQVIPNYDRNTAPVIALPGPVHRALAPDNIRGTYTGSARDLLAQNLWSLRNQRVPNSALQELLDLNRSTYPGVFD